ncbi:MAG: hypothetical protein K9N49_06300 [Candidatus Marinimicrobia bacterium]|nr:hypothetical protein [Candidatus Neomarinimicrobiota bacterium]
MTAAALAILSRQGKRFLLVAKEEGTDNFANVNNAGGILARAQGTNAEALRSGHCDSSDIYRLMYLTLSGRPPETPHR